MIPTKNRRLKSLKLPRNIERLYKEGKCRECAVVVTRMDFAKILGKFTKVKIQYESSTTPKTKQNNESSSPNSNARLKSNENGMVLIHRNAYNQHPVKDLLGPPKVKGSETPARHTNNVLKENNSLKKTVLKDTGYNYKKQSNSNLKKYGIIFTDPTTNNNNCNDIKNKITLTEILPHIDDSILPTEEWCIDYFPKNDEPKDDKVYDRIAAELEDLMYSDKPVVKLDQKSEALENKVDEFPSIMDILNDTAAEIVKPNDQSNSIEFKSNLESSDVEAMLLGKPEIESKPQESTPMEVENTDVTKLIEDVEQLDSAQQAPVEQLDSMQQAPVEQLDSVQQAPVEQLDSVQQAPVEELDSVQQAPVDISKTEAVGISEGNPQSPSILDEALQKGIEEHLPPEPLKDIGPKYDDSKKITYDSTKADTISTDVETTENCNKNQNDDSKNTSDIKNNLLASKAGITQVVFKKTKDDMCYKSVTCPKNLKYSIELEGKSVELLGAPKYISSLEDLQVLLQIVNESELGSLHVLH